jgi:hypothetical protein
MHARVRISQWSTSQQCTGRVAQWIAYQTSNLGVAGSSPAVFKCAKSRIAATRWPSGLRRQFKALVFGRGFESHSCQLRVRYVQVCLV